MWWGLRKSEADKFLALLLRSGLLDKAGICKACSGVDAQSAGETEVDRLCSHLVANGSITQWQCDKLREGKWRGFFLDKYKIIDHIGKDDSGSTYLVVDLDSAQKVGLRVKFPVRKGRSLEYEIVDPKAD